MDNLNKNYAWSLFDDFDQQPASIEAVEPIKVTQLDDITSNSESAGNDPVVDSTSSESDSNKLKMQAVQLQAERKRKSADTSSSTASSKKSSKKKTRKLMLAPIDSPATSLGICIPAVPTSEILEKYANTLQLEMMNDPSYSAYRRPRDIRKEDGLVGATGSGSNKSVNSADQDLDKLVGVYSPKVYYRLIIGAILSGCVTDLQKVIYQLCTPDCLLKTGVLKLGDTAPLPERSFRGRENIFGYFKGILDSFPDIQYTVETGYYSDDIKITNDAGVEQVVPWDGPKVVLSHSTCKGYSSNNFIQVGSFSFLCTGTMLKAIHEAEVDTKFDASDPKESESLRKARHDVQILDFRGMCMLVLNEAKEIETLILLFTAQARKSQVE